MNTQKNRKIKEVLDTSVLDHSSWIQYKLVNQWHNYNNNYLEAVMAKKKKPTHLIRQHEKSNKICKTSCRKFLHIIKGYREDGINGDIYYVYGRVD